MALNWIRVNHRSLDNWCLNNERCRAALADAHCVMRSSPSSLSTPCLCSAACYSRSWSSSWAGQSASSSVPLPTTPLSLLIALKPFLTYVLGQGLWAVAIQNSARLSPGVPQPGSSHIPAYVPGPYQTMNCGKRVTVPLHL